MCTYSIRLVGCLARCLPDDPLFYFCWRPLCVHPQHRQSARACLNMSLAISSERLKWVFFSLNILLMPIFTWNVDQTLVFFSCHSTLLHITFIIDRKVLISLSVQFRTETKKWNWDKGMGWWLAGKLSVSECQIIVEIFEIIESFTDGKWPEAKVWAPYMVSTWYFGLSVVM